MEKDRRDLEQTRPREIYSAVLTFRKPKKSKEPSVSVVIRQTKRGPTLKGKLPWPESIKDLELFPWTSYQGLYVSVYHRISDNLGYENMEHSAVHPDLSQRLEKIVRDVQSMHKKINL